MAQDMKFCSFKALHDHFKAFKIAVVGDCCRVSSGTGKLKVEDTGIIGERVDKIMHNLMGKG
ncbi:hypothetical protein ES705_34853 [subsurface metagenome]